MYYSQIYHLLAGEEARSMGKALCTDLPIELWDLILDKLDPTLDSKSLAAYSLTSRVASNLARPRLFSTTRIPVGGDNNNNRFPLFQRFALATLTVCQHIRQLELYQGSDAFRDGKLSDIVDVDELYNVLPAFPSLRMLNLNNISLASTSMRLYDKPAMIYLDHLIITSHRYHNKENYYHEPCPAVIIPCAFSLFKSLGTLEIRGLSVISCRCPSVNADAGGPWHSDAYFRKLFAVHRIGEFDIRKLVLPHPLYEFPMLYLAKALLNGGVDSLADVAMSTGDPRDIEVYCELMNENSRSLASFALEVGTWREYEGFGKCMMFVPRSCECLFIIWCRITLVEFFVGTVHVSHNSQAIR